MKRLTLIILLFFETAALPGLDFDPVVDPKIEGLEPYPDFERYVPEGLILPDWAKYVLVPEDFKNITPKTALTLATFNEVHKHAEKLKQQDIEHWEERSEWIRNFGKKTSFSDSSDSSGQDPKKTASSDDTYETIAFCCALIISYAIILASPLILNYIKWRLKRAKSRPKKKYRKTFFGKKVLNEVSLKNNEWISGHSFID